MLFGDINLVTSAKRLVPQKKSERKQTYETNQQNKTLHLSSW